MTDTLNTALNSIEWYILDVFDLVQKANKETKILIITLLIITGVTLAVSIANLLKYRKLEKLIKQLINTD